MVEKPAIHTSSDKTKIESSLSVAFARLAAINTNVAHLLPEGMWRQMQI